MTTAKNIEMLAEFEVFLLDYLIKGKTTDARINSLGVKDLKTWTETLTKRGFPTDLTSAMNTVITEVDEIDRMFLLKKIARSIPQYRHQLKYRAKEFVVEEHIAQALFDEGFRDCEGVEKSFEILISDTENLELSLLSKWVWEQCPPNWDLVAMELEDLAFSAGK